MTAPHLPPRPAVDHGRRDRVFARVCLSAAVLPLSLLLVLLVQVAVDAAPRISLDFLTGYPSRDPLLAGIWPGLVGSVFLIGMTGLFAFPIGIGAAIFLEEYGGNNRLARIIEINIANLAGVPSVIYGLLGLGLFVRGFGLGRSVLAGALTLALLVLPIIIISSREALRAVPPDLREASWALGATRWQTIHRVVLPTALPGMLTGAILATARAFGETAPIVMLGAVTYITFAPDTPLSQFTAIPLQILDWVRRPVSAGFAPNAAAGIVVLLLTMLTLNAVAIWLRDRLSRRMQP